MTELTTQPPKQNLWRRVTQNPITMKELRSRMRGRRAFVVLTIYLAVMSGFLSLVYLAYAASANDPYGPDGRDAGKVVMAVVLSAQAFIVIFVGPAFTASAISGEKEHQTYDLLRTTLLPANWFVAGKLISALSYVFLLIFASIPLQSIAFLLGGVSGLELVVSQIIMLTAAVTFALYGLFCSSMMRSTIAASVMTYGGSLFFTIGLPSLILLGVAMISPFLFGISSIGWVGEAALALGGVFLAATNLPATLIVSDLFLTEEGAVFYMTQSFYGSGTSHSIPLPSPWIIFLALYSLVALFLYWLTVRRVKKISNK